MIYFLDTYALIEIVKGNKNYERFLSSEFFTSLFNLYEFYFILLKDFDDDTAKNFSEKFRHKIVNIEDKNIFEASNFKLKNFRKKFSYADCLGYVVAKNLGIKFLTGDKQFEKFENVEFVR